MAEQTSAIDYSRTPDGLDVAVLERAGCALHYWLGGPADRPGVVLIHGGGLDHRMFNPQVEVLLPHYRVLLPDVRGHGRSQPMGEAFTLELAAADVIAILDHAGIARAVVGGQSMGGMIAQHVYRLAPERVQAMIVIDAVPVGKSYSWLDVLATRWSVPLLRWWPYDNLRRVAASTAVRDPAARRYAYEAMGQMSQEAFRHFWEGTAQAVTREGIPGLRIGVPLLLMHGDRDRNGTIVRDAPGWARSEPDVTYVVIPEAAHNANQDNPAAANAAIGEFLAARVE